MKIPTTAYQSLYDQYQSGMSFQAIENITGYNRHDVSFVLRNYYGIQPRRRLYYINDKFFENIISEEQACWLGFIAADGCVYYRKTSKTLSFNLNVRDEEHLLKFKKAISSTALIRHKMGSGFGEGTEIVELVINSNKICEDLAKQNIVPHKSLILKPPNLPEELVSHWIRGYFDGDGSISLTEKAGYINFIGTKEVLTFIQNFLRPNAEKVQLQKRYSDNKNCYYFSYGGTNSILIALDKFYASPSIYLERKYNKVLEVYSRFGKKSPKVLEEELLETLK